MRNLKKVLSLCVALVMLLGVMATASAVTFNELTDKASVTHKDEVGLLVELGIINGIQAADGTYSFQPATTVTRAQMAKMICVLLNRGIDNPSLFAGMSTFVDTKGHWAEGYIAYCANLGIIAGYGDGNFGPDDSVTGTQAAKMLLTALGYAADKEGYINTPSYAININVDAASAGIFDDFTGSVDAALTRDNAALLIYNGLFAQTVSYSATTGARLGNTIGATSTSSYLAYEKFDLTTIVGVATKNDGGILGSETADSSANDGKTYIDITTQNGLTPTMADGYFSAASDASVLGKTVKLYVKGTSYTKVYGTPVLASVNKVVETKAVLSNAVVTVSGSLLKFAKDNGVTIDAGTAYITYSAGVAVTTAFTSTAKGQLLTLIDNDGDGTCDYAVKTIMSAAKVTGITTTTVSGVTTTKYSGTVLTSANTDTVFVKNDIALYYQFNGEYISEKASVVQGKISNFAAVGTATGIVVNGTTYTQSSLAALGSTIAGFNQSSSATYSTTYNVYLDKSGYVVNISTVTTAASDYAVLLDMAYVAGSGIAGSAKVEAKLMFTDGTTAVVNLYKITAVDTVVYGTSAAVTAGAATTAFTSANVTRAAGVDTILNTADDTGLAATEAAKFFTYSVNADGLYSLTYKVATTATVADINNPSAKVNYNGTNNADASTIFMVAKVGASSTTYAAYVGYANVPKIVTPTIELQLDTDATPDGIDDIVFVVAASANIGAATSPLAFITSTNYVYNFVSGGTSYYEYPAIVNGTASTVKATTALFTAKDLYTLTVNAAGYTTAATAKTANKITALSDGIIANSAGAYVVSASTVVYVIGTDYSVTTTDTSALSVGTYVYIVDSSPTAGTAAKVYAYPVVAGLATTLSLAPGSTVTETSDLVVGTPATAAVYTGYTTATPCTIVVTAANTNGDVAVALKSGPATYNATTGTLTLTGTGTVVITVTTGEAGKVDKTTDYTITVG